MAASPPFKVFNPEGVYIGSTKFASDAAVLVSVQGDGAKVKYQHQHTVWTEGSENIKAAESYDAVATTIDKRVAALRRSWGVPE
jgi:hypothetical protein